MPLGRIALCSVKGIVKIIEYEKEVTGNGYIDLTDAVVNKLLELKAYGGCVQDLTPTPSTPVDIVCNNGTLKLKDKELPVGYKRLSGIKTDGSVSYKITDFYLTGEDDIKFRFNKGTATGGNCLGSYTSSSAKDNFSMYFTSNSGGKYTRYNGSTYTSYIPNSNTTYRINIGVSGVQIGTNGTLVPVTPATFTCSEEFYIFTIGARQTNTPNGCYFNGNITVTRGDNVRLNLIPCERVSDGELGWYDTVGENFYENLGDGTPTSTGYDYDNIEVYVDGTKEKVGYSGGATATCEDLLGVGTYLDEQEILSGNVITKVGVLVLDGTEDRTTIDQYNRVSVIVNEMVAPSGARVIPALCTHFENLHNSESIGSITAGQFYTASPKRIYFHISQSTTADFKTWLASQYNAGTPVIVVYPLATPTTLSVAGQSLSIPAGNSRIEIVEGSILDLPLYAKYKSTTE